MRSKTFRFDDDLMAWLEFEARLNHRSVNKQAEYFLSQLKRENEKQRVNLGSVKMCQNGLHNFKSFSPAMNEFCNCGVFIYGEMAR